MDERCGAGGKTRTSRRTAPDRLPTTGSAQREVTTEWFTPYGWYIAAFRCSRRLPARCPRGEHLKRLR